MAKATVAERSPCDPLPRNLQEEVHMLIERARAIALLIEADPGEDDWIYKNAAGAISDALSQANQIMRTGKAFELQEVARHG